jgi:hypothetical protein
LDEKTRAVLDGAADEVFDAAMRLISIGEAIDEIIKDGDEAEAEAPQYGPGDQACQSESREDPARVKRQMTAELRRLVWLTEGTDPKPVPAVPAYGRVEVSGPPAASFPAPSTEPRTKGTRVNSTHSDLRQMPRPAGIGFGIDPETLKIVCLNCPDPLTRPNASGSRPTRFGS